MNIPKNGRIAIIDDQFEQAYPLMELCGKHQLPYVYYNGRVEGLPDEGSNFNDVRLVFLDINLTGNAARTEKEIKSSLFPVLNRIISEKNYPYLLVFWSRHEGEYRKVIDEIFANELAAKKPVNILSLRKSDYFNLDGSTVGNLGNKMMEIFDRITGAVNQYPVYGHLLAWENLIHKSADRTLEEIFRIASMGDEWNQNSNYLFYKLSSSYSGKNFTKIADPEKVKNSFYTLNMVLNDSLEYSIAKTLAWDNPAPHRPDNLIGDNEIIYHINKKLLFVSEEEDKLSPGMLSKTDPGKHNYAGILSDSISRERLFHEFRNEIEDTHKKNGNNLTKIRDDKFKSIKREIKESWLCIEANVTPICDFVQQKEGYHRIVPGLLIKKEFKYLIDHRTEALFASPDFKIEIPNSPISGTYFLLLDFKYFYSERKEVLQEQMTPFLRVRQQLLTEIQSKLARHINRQG